MIADGLTDAGFSFGPVRLNVVAASTAELQAVGRQLGAAPGPPSHQPDVEAS